ncbi:MAG TPA: hypothetical protein DEP84_21980 [Chloroflexi bacterium]|nr:hypothetical protein [Chloroflexota bacterium]
MARLYRSPVVAGLRVRLVREVQAPATRHSAITLAGNLSRFLLGFVTSVLIARFLGPAGYGLIALVSLVLAVADTVGDFGLTYTAVRALARVLGPEPERARRLARGFFSLAVITNVIAAVVGILLAGPIARVVLGRPEAEPYLRLAMIGLIAVAGNGFIVAVLQSMRRFGQLAGLQILSALTYLIGVFALVAANRLDVASVILLGAVNPLVGFVVGLRFLPPGFFSFGEALARPSRQAWRELAAFSKWLWVSAILSLLAAQLDLVMLSRWTPAAAVGVYALAFNLAMKMDIVSQTRLTVLLPGVSSLRTSTEMRTFVVRSLKRSAVLIAGSALFVPFFRPFIVTFYGPDYADAVKALLVLTLVVLFDLATTPVILLGFPLEQPRALAASDAVRLATLVASGWLLIPTFGPVGAALARLAARVAGALFMVTLIALRLRKMSRSSLLSSASAPGS